jgi:hypothetical protein
MGETTSLTIQRLKGEDISHQNYVSAGQSLCNPSYDALCQSA